MTVPKQDYFSKIAELDARKNLSLEEWISNEDNKMDLLLKMTEEEQNQYWQNQILNENHMDEMHELDDI